MAEPTTTRMKLKFSRPGTVGCVRRNIALNDTNALINMLSEQCGSFLTEVTILDTSRTSWVKQVTEEETDLGFSDWKKREQTTA